MTMQAFRSAFGAGLFLSLLLASPGWASEAGRPLPSGIVFPEDVRATTVNPAGLAQSQGTLLGLGYAPRNDEGDSREYRADLATRLSSVGLGAGFFREEPPLGGEASHRFAVGGGVQLSGAALGLSYLSAPMGAGAGGDSDVNFGLLLGSGRGTQYGVVLNDLGSSPTLEFGAGYADAGKYNLEASLLLPPFSSGGGGVSVYELHVAAATYISWFGLSFSSGYQVATAGDYGGTGQSGTLPAQIAMLLAPARSWSASIRTDVSNQLTFGLTIRL